MISKIGIIVDGQGEYHSFNERFKNENIKVMKTDGPRGHNAKISDIVNRSKKQVEMLRCYGCSKVIILLDLESRDISIDDFRQNAMDCINSTQFSVKTEIAIADKMIENWYLADIAYISTKKKYIKKQQKQKMYEGQHGKKELKKLFIRGYDYNEVIHGKELFNTLRFKNASVYSSSLKDFLEKLYESSI